MANQIRNIAQTVQEREIIKTCPDIVIYVEGKPFLINPYLNSKDPKSQSNGLYTLVNFNDYVDSFSAAYRTEDGLIPSASFTLSVPNSQKHLFQAPGGNNIFETMMQVQVFAKGYFPSPKGNTLYYRVFKGLIGNVSHTDTGTSLQISVNCVGTLRFLDLMYIDLAPALYSNSPNVKVPLISNQFNMSPYAALADTFLRAVTMEGFQLNSIQQALLKLGIASAGTVGNRSAWSDAVSAGYIQRWQVILNNIVRDVRILGYDAQAKLEVSKDPFARFDTLTDSPDDANAKLSFDIQSAESSRMPKESVAQQLADKDYFVGIMRHYLPDMQPNSVKLLDHKITSRIERIRNLVNLIGYEMYQDLDGAIIFKPPFYNLDVTDLGPPISSGTSGSGTPFATSAASYIREGTNPFVVYLSEIEEETETEDEQAIRTTRMTVSPDWMSNYHTGFASPSLMPVSEHIDIAKLAKFGLREEPARQLPFLGVNDKFALYAYAVSEMNKANRGYRTYSFTIPMRPELRLGFPMYIPHKDMYGYINSISISYQQAGTATMHITLDTVRKRPLLPHTQTVTGPDGNDKEITIYQSQPNLVMEWTKAPASALANPAGRNPVCSQPPLNLMNYSQGAAGAGNSGSPSNNNLVNLVGNFATLPQAPDTPFRSEEWEYLMNRKEKLGSIWATRFDTKTNSFRVQKDEATAEDAAVKDGAGNEVPTGIKEGKPFFSSDNWIKNHPGITSLYYLKILSCQPYTDEKGYEVVTPFPWGRWVDVNTAIRQSRLGILTNAANVQGAATVQNMYVFLFAGLAAPTSTSMVDTLNSTINGTQQATTFDSVELDSVIELLTPQPGQGNIANDTNLTNDAQPDMKSPGPESNISALQSRLTTFLTGGSGLPDMQPLKGTETTNPELPSIPTLPPFLQNIVKGGSE